MAVVRAILRQMLTGKDNQTHDIVRWACALGVLVGLGLVIWDELHGTHFDFINYGLGLGGMLTAVSAALKFKASTEPSP